ncbi:hypothetical protein [Staphylococcus epidermidis]|nr:hypothetical protein [Staphylococcus epidermidis]
MEDVEPITTSYPQSNKQLKGGNKHAKETKNSTPNRHLGGGD